MTLWSPKPPLNGAAIFLSASVPHPHRDKRFLDGPLDDWLMLRVIDQRVFDAVSSLVAQVLMAGGRVVHGGHPSITNVIARQAGNWMASDVEPVEAAKPSVLLYQSEFFKNDPAPPGRDEMLGSGFAAVNWTATTFADCRMDGVPIRQRFNLRPEWIERWLPKQAEQEASASKHEALLVMRLQMLLETQPRTVVCIGGMEGIEAEAELYRDLCCYGLLPSGGGVQVMASTFGSSAKISGEKISVVDEGLSSTCAEQAMADMLDRLEYDGVARKLVAALGVSMS